MFYRIPFEVETGHQPLQNVASLSDKSNRVQRWFDVLNAYNSTLKQRSRNANVDVDVLSRPPLPATAGGLQPRYRLTDPSGLAVYYAVSTQVPAEFPQDFEHRRTQVWVDWPTPQMDWQTLWVDWRPPPTMFFL